jgi:CDP-diacylglycerol--serine O-phosphatidyltransferase
MPRFLALVLVLILTGIYYEWMPFVLFLTYLLYGFLRPFLSSKMKEEIEDDGEPDGLPEDPSSPL